MDFFARQEEARRRTRALAGLFAAAVAAIVLAVYLAVRLLLYNTGVQVGEEERDPFLDLELFAGTAAATLLVIAVGSIYKSAQLARGGSVVAQALGGRPVQPNSTDAKERRLLNVVEEMALAAGLPVPSVYLLEKEPGINAFAAGLTSGDAVVAVTRGALDELSRDELQGVLGHEFSHILNGDMRINVRLAGLLHGILVIALIGYWILRGTGGRSSGSSKKGGGGIALFGLALLVVGWVGVFFGRLIQAAVSRQREFLADSSAVQFTRNPAGLAGALARIASFGSGSAIASHQSEEVGHFFFADGVAKRFFGFLATHPPIAERIRRLDPSLAPPVEASEATPLGDLAAALAGSDDAAVVTSRAAGTSRSPSKAAAFVAAAGRLDAGTVANANALLAGLPGGLREAAREPLTAQALVLGLLLDPRPEVRDAQLTAVAESGNNPLLGELRQLEPSLAAIATSARLPLVDLTLPALRRLSPEQYADFDRLIERLVAADSRIGLFEFSLQRVLRRHLASRFGGRPQTGVRFTSISQVREPSHLLLSALAWCGGGDPGQPERAFEAGIALLPGAAAPPQLTPRERCGLAEIDRALADLATAAPAVRRSLLTACAATVAADRIATADELELLRAIADSLGCPIPPVAAAIAA